jgi:hypothetical protein
MYEKVWSILLHTPRAARSGTLWTGQSSTLPIQDKLHLLPLQSKLYHSYAFLLCGFVCLFIYLFKEVLGWELRAPLLLGRHSTTWVTSPVLFVFWKQGPTFCPGWPGPRASYFMLPTTGGLTDTYHSVAAFFCWDGVWCNFFFAQAGL